MTTAKHRERAREIRRIFERFNLEEFDGAKIVATADAMEAHALKLIAAAHAEGREEMREKAAKVAAEFDYDGEFPDENKMPQGWAGCRRLIAAAIRSLPKDTGNGG